MSNFVGIATERTEMFEFFRNELNVLPWHRPHTPH